MQQRLIAERSRITGRKTTFHASSCWYIDASRNQASKREHLSNIFPGEITSGYRGPVGNSTSSDFIDLCKSGARERGGDNLFEAGRRELGHGGA